MTIQERKNIIKLSKTNDAIAFGEWLRTFHALTRENGQWCLMSQISTEELYLLYRRFVEEE